VQVVVAEDDLDAAFVPHSKLQRFKRFRAAVDDVAGQPECVGAVVETDFVEQGGQFVEAALNIADCVVCHIRILALDGLLCFRRPFKGNRNMRPSEKGCTYYAVNTSTASASTCTPLGRAATPTAARAGKGSWMNSAMTSLKTAKLARSVR